MGGEIWEWKGREREGENSKAKARARREEDGWICSIMDLDMMRGLEGYEQPRSVHSIHDWVNLPTVVIRNDVDVPGEGGLEGRYALSVVYRTVFERVLSHSFRGGAGCRFC